MATSPCRACRMILRGERRVIARRGRGREAVQKARPSKYDPLRDFLTENGDVRRGPGVPVPCPAAVATCCTGTPAAQHLADLSRHLVSELVRKSGDRNRGAEPVGE